MNVYFFKKRKINTIYKNVYISVNLILIERQKDYINLEIAIGNPYIKKVCVELTIYAHPVSYVMYSIIGYKYG